MSSSVNRFYEAFHSSVVSLKTKMKENSTLPLAFNCLLACDSGKLYRWSPKTKPERERQRKMTEKRKQKEEVRQTEVSSEEAML